MCTANMKDAHLLALNGLWHVAVGNLLGQTLCNGSLANTGFAYQTGVVLGAATQNLCDTLDLCLPAHHRIQLALHKRGQALNVCLYESSRQPPQEKGT